MSRAGFSGRSLPGRRSWARLRLSVSIGLAVCALAAYSLQAVGAGGSPVPRRASTMAEAPSRASAPSASGTAVLNPSVSINPDVAGAASARYALTFTLSSAGELLAGAGSIQVAAPAGATFQAVAPSLVDRQHPEESDTFLLEGYPSQVADDGEEYSVTPAKELYGGDTITLTIGDVVNWSRSGRYYLRLWTTADTVPVDVPFTLVPATGQVVRPSVTLSSDAAGATNVSYRLDFNTSADGALSAGACHSYWGETIDVSLPPGTKGLHGPTGPGPGGLEAKLTDTSLGQAQEPECGYSFFSNPVISTNGGIIVFPLASDVGDDNALQLDLSGVTNPTKPGDYSLMLWTMSDPVPALVSYRIGDGGAPASVAAPSLTTSSAAAAATTDYGLSFTMSTPGLAARSGIIYLLAPQGADLVGASVEVKDRTSGAVGVVQPKLLQTGPLGANQMLSFPSPVSVRGGDRVEVEVAGATNPPAGHDELGVWTSADPRVVFATYSTTGTAADQTAVNPVGVSVSNAIFTGDPNHLGLGGITLTASLTLSATGGLAARTGVIYLESRTGLNLDSGGCAGNRLYCPFTVTVTDLTHPEDSAAPYSEDASGVGPVGTVLAVNAGHALQGGDALTVSVTGINISPAGAADLDALTVWTSADTLPQQLSVPKGSGGFVYGTVSTPTGQIPGWVVLQVCPADGAACLQSTTLTTGSVGSFALVLPTGQDAVTAFPNAGMAAVPQTAAGIEVTNGELSPAASIVFGSLANTAIPAGSNLTSPGWGTETGARPTLYNSQPSTYTTHGCKDGFGLVTIQGTDESTGEPETRQVALVETPAGSGTYVADIPPLMPIHGASSVSQWVSCPPPSPVFPSGGPPQGGSTVLLSGHGFRGATAVTFGRQAALSFKVISDTLISAVVPPGTGRVPIAVTTPSSDPLAGNYTYVAVTGLSSHSGPSSGGNTVTIYGQGFTGTLGVLFGTNYVPGSEISPSGRSSTEFTVTVPPELSNEGQTVNVIVLDGTGGYSAVSGADEYTYTGPAPASPGQTSSTSTGGGAAASSCDSACAVTAVLGAFTTIAGTAIQILSGSDAVNAFTMEKLLGSDNVDTGLDIIAKLAGQDGVLEIGSLDIDLLSDFAVFTALPVIGVLGAVLGGIALGVLIWQLFIDPSGTVVDQMGNPVRRATVTLLERPPGGTSFSPVPNGSSTISPATDPEVTSASGAFHWEAVAGTYRVEASAAGCHAVGSRSPDVLTAPFVLPPPVTGLLVHLVCPAAKPANLAPSGLYPESGPSGGGNQVEVTGNGLGAVTSVRFGAHLARAQVVSPSEVIAVAPAGAGKVTVKVTTAVGRTVALAARYLYVATKKNKGAPSIRAVRPSSGPLSGGTHVTITGANLRDVVSVQFGGVDATSFAAASPSKLYAIVPASALAGTATVTLVNLAGTSVPTSRSVFDYARAGPEPLPGRPTRLSAKSAKGTLLLSWRAPANERSADVLAYEVEWSGAAHRTGSVQFEGTTPAVVLPLFRSGIYRFQVRAENAVGYGPWSAVLRAT